MDNYVETIDLRNQQFVKMKLERRWNDESYSRAYYSFGDESIVVSNTSERTLHIVRSFDGKRILDCHADNVNSHFNGILTFRSDPFNDFNFLMIMIDDEAANYGLFQCELL